MILLPKDTWKLRTQPQKGRGIFATKTIRAGMVIGDYIGTVINNAVDDTREKDGLYLMYYHDRASIYPTDLQAPGIHLMNHSCMPNCWLYTYKGHTLFFTLRTIFPGEELTADYLLSPEEYCKQCTHQCFCDTLLCRGTMHLAKQRFQAWNTFHERQAKETKRMPIRYGKQLIPLSTYPQQIMDDTIYNLFGSTSEEPVINKVEKLPSISALRKMIRKTGKMHTFPELGYTVVGIQNGEIISRSVIS
jgi:hypothetical protein